MNVCHPNLVGTYFHHAHSFFDIGPSGPLQSIHPSCGPAGHCVALERGVRRSQTPTLMTAFLSSRFFKLSLGIAPPTKCSLDPTRNVRFEGARPRTEHTHLEPPSMLRQQPSSRR